jgi:uncharacterized damage-inducible protein DinB
LKETALKTGIRFRELMHYAEAQTRRWRGFFQQQPDALDVEVDIAGTRDISSLIQHIFAAELRYAERLEGAAVTAYEQLPSRSLDEIFSIGETARQKIRRYLTRATEADLRTVLTFETRTAGTLSSSKRKIVGHVLHGIRHWAQIATALRQGGYRQDWPHDFIFTDALE